MFVCTRLFQASNVNMSLINEGFFQTSLSLQMAMTSLIEFILIVCTMRCMAMTPGKNIYHILVTTKLSVIDQCLSTNHRFTFDHNYTHFEGMDKE